MKMIGSATLLFILGFSGVANAQISTTSPHQIGFYCPPYTEPFIEGGFYEIATTSGACTWNVGTIPPGIPAAPHYGGLFRGIVGSSTGAGNFMGFATETALNRGPIPDPVQGEPFFAAIWEVRNGPAFQFDLPNFLNFFRTGSNPPPSNGWGVINFKWGELPLKECCSNIAFIPGIKATELFEGDSKRWLPGLFGFDASRLEMNVAGESTNGITVGDSIRRAYQIIEIYDGFFGFLDNLKSSDAIADWKSLPYDWRYDVYDIAAQDQHLSDDSLFNLAEQIRDLAQDSDTGKVTLITHSNGGLVGKALIDALGPDALLIDRFIMVGTPQLGTPSAIAAMLHGIEQGLPIDSASFVMSKALARELSENMPGAYGLLPLAEYFSVVDVASDPPVMFDDFSDTAVFRNAYGDAIDTPSELQSFLLGIGDGRAKPSSGDTLTPTILNGTLLADSLATRNTLESWIAQDGIEVIQIVGWGLDTPKTVHYYQRCEAFAGCFMDTKPEFTSDGDSTVVSPSADAFAGADTYYLNLSAFNAANETSWTHANILAASSIQDFLQDVVLKTERSAPFISTVKPVAADASKRLRLSVHSPVSIGVRDSEGRFTGVIPNPDLSSDIPVIVEEIPNSYYLEFGDGKYIGFDVNDVREVVIQGTAEGTFTLEVEEIDAGATVNAITYSDAPVSPTMVAELRIQNIENTSELEIDNNGDGVIDETVAPDGTAVSLEELIALLKHKIQNLDVKNSLKKNLLKKVEKLEKKIEKQKKEKSGKVLNNLGKKISKKEMKGKIETAGAQEILKLLEQIESAL